MAPHRVLLFGDQTVEKLPSIQDLVRVSRNSPLLRRFLQDAADVVQTEVAKLNLDTRRAFVNFDSFVTLAEENAKQDADEVVATTLMCIARLGQLLMLVVPHTQSTSLADDIAVTLRMIQVSWTVRTRSCTC